MGKSKGKRPLEKARRVEKKSKMYLQETGWENVDWIQLAQDKWQALLKRVISLPVPQNWRIS